MINVVWLYQTMINGPAPQSKHKDSFSSIHCMHCAQLWLTKVTIITNYENNQHFTDVTRTTSTQD